MLTANDTYGYHRPVMLAECLEGLNIRPDGIYVDVTFGGGGHSRAILSRLGEGGRLYAFDRDGDAARNSIDDPRFCLIHENFAHLKNFLRLYGMRHIDGLLADLGVSSHHFDDAERGFSFRFDAALDMRMNKRAGQTAADILNNYSEEQLADVFYLYGELKQARRIAAAIVKTRSESPLQRTNDLMQIAEPFFRQDKPGKSEKKEMAKLFQALRIEVNHEMEALTDMLYGACDVLGESGRLVVITYHSLEDRLVKNMMKAGNTEGRVSQDFFGRVEAPFRAVGKVIVPNADEQQRNPRSRSAKLRIAERV